MANQVKLTFAGDSKNLESTFARVGIASKLMSDKVKESSKGFDDAGRNVSKFGEGVEAAGRLAIPAAATAAALLGAAVAPALAVALAGGVVLAIGGGALVAGIALAASNPRVGKAFDGLKNRLMDMDTTPLEAQFKSAQARMTAAVSPQAKARAAIELAAAKKALDDAQAYNKKNFSLKDAAEPFVKPLVASLKIFQDAAGTILPQVGKIFDTMAPVVTDLTNGLVGLIKNALPGLADGASASVPAFKAIAGFLPTVGKWIGTFVTKMAELFAWGIKNRESIGHFISVLGPIVGIFLAIIAAIRIWIAVQTILNVVMALNPIGLIIIAVAALVAIIIVIATKTTWFQRLWGAAWGGIKTAASNVWNWIKQIPGWIVSAFSTIGNAISAPFKAAFNYIANAWNSGPGALSFSIPDWIPVIGGDSFSMPKLPTFHSGGVVPGVVGTSVLAMVQAGERVGSVASGGDGMVIQLNIGNTALGDVLIDAVRGAVRTRGGNVQAVLGRG